MDDFSLSSYSQMILAFRERGYTFLKFQELTISRLSAPVVILRHDVDFCIQDVVDIAELEQQQGVSSTFFFQLRSPLYNSLSKYASHQIQHIHALGHDIALHFDHSLYRDSESLISELKILKEYYPFANTRIVSFHRPGPDAVGLVDLHLPDGIRHTYEEIYFRNLAYYSDSRGEWRHGHPVKSEAFKDGRSMQIVTHPMWWVAKGENPIQKIADYLQRSRLQSISFLEDTAVSLSLKRLRAEK